MRIESLKGTTKSKFNLAVILLLVVLFSGLFSVSVFPGLYTVFPVNLYLTIHTLAEFISVVVSLAVALIAWYSYQQEKGSEEFFICLTFVAVGLIDFAHTMSYKGMPDFFTPNSVNKASTYWITARLVQACGFLVVVFANRFKLKNKVNLNFYLRGILLLTVVLIAVIAAGRSGIPPMFIPGIGQTMAKMILEYVIITIEILSLAYLMTIKEKKLSEQYLEAALLLGIFSEIAFTLYSSAYDTYNLIGHIYKIIAFVCILQGLFVTSVVRLHVTNRILKEQRRKLSHMNAQLARVNKLKTDFLANTNHELRTPLTAIIAFTELLLDKETGPLNELQKDYLQEINDSSQRLLSEINNLLELSKIEAGVSKVYPESTNLNDVIEAVTKQLRSVFHQKNQNITVKVQPDIPVMNIDRQKITKVITNLLSNAHKFTEPGGNISINAAVAEDGEGVTVNVKDDGIGVPKEQSANIFDMFYQIEHSLTKQFHGTGIGLTLVKHFVELHGGRVWVKSEPGEGSTFSFYIPFSTSKEEAV